MENKNVVVVEGIENNIIEVSSIDGIIGGNKTLYKIENQDFFIKVDKVKNDINGNPRYKINMFDNNFKNVSYNLKFKAKEGKYNKNNNSLVVQSFNISNTLENILNDFLQGEQFNYNFNVVDFLNKFDFTVDYLEQIYKDDKINKIRYFHNVYDINVYYKSKSIEINNFSFLYDYKNFNTNKIISVFNPTFENIEGDETLNYKAKFEVFYDLYRTYQDIEELKDSYNISNISELKTVYYKKYGINENIYDIDLHFNNIYNIYDFIKNLINKDILKDEIIELLQEY